MKNAIVYLVRSSEKDIEEFVESIRSLENFFFKNNPADIICFHEKTLNNYIPTINNRINTNIKYIEIEFSIPDSNKNLEIPEFYPHPTHGNGPIAYGHPGFTLGYRHMCRFFAGEIFKNQNLNEYKFIMRMDTDSKILRPVQYNVFDYMLSNNKYYGFIADAVQLDNPKVCENLSSGALDWFNLNKSACLKQPIKDIEEHRIYYTNFEICDLNWFKNSKYLDFYDFIDHLGGIYTNRWGDHVIRYLGVNMLMEDVNKYPIYNIAYQHGATYNI